MSKIIFYRLIGGKWGYELFGWLSRAHFSHAKVTVSHTSERGLFASLPFSQTGRRSKLAEMSSAATLLSCGMWKYLSQQFAKKYWVSGICVVYRPERGLGQTQNPLWSSLKFRISRLNDPPGCVAKNLLRSRLWCVVNYHPSQHHFLFEYPRRQREGSWRQRLHWDLSKWSKKSRSITERTEITSDKL